MIKYENKEQLQKTINAFLRQRGHYYKATSQPALHMVCMNMLMQFDQISGWDYWRHCLEAKNSRANLYKILPSQRGTHQKIRENMILLIRHCTTITRIPRQVYLDQTKPKS
jgi:hypothetical protein